MRKQEDLEEMKRLSNIVTVSAVPLNAVGTCISSSMLYLYFVDLFHSIKSSARALRFLKMCVALLLASASSV